MGLACTSLRWIWPAALICLIGPPALAADGVFEINETCARISGTGCFPGDAPSPPVTITQPGSYVLTSNIYVPDPNDPAVIQIAASHVTLDLNGFMISGPSVCSGSPLSCTPTGTLKGITTDTARTGVVILNGFVRGMPNEGVDLVLGNESRVEQVQAISNAVNGIAVGESSLVRGCLARLNGSVGILTGSESTVRESHASQNGQDGISLTSGLASGNVAVRNGSTGIGCGSECRVTGSQAIYNQRPGIYALAGGIQVSANHVFGNSIGISVCEATVRENHVRNNTGLGLEVRCSTVADYAGNRFYENNGGNANAQVGGGGTWMETGTNFCGTDTICP
jgi:hypothetical protein